MTRYAVTHETKYNYSIPVALGLHTARISPVEGARQKLIAHTIDVDPVPAWSVAFTDHFGNSIHHIAIETSHEALTVTQRTVVDVLTPTQDQPAGPSWESVRDIMRSDEFPVHPDVAEFIYASPLIAIEPTAVAYAQEIFKPDTPIVTAAFALASRIKQEFAYAPGVTSNSTSVMEIMTERRGVCQDFAHVMISGLRGLGLPIRYVSGYLKTHAAPGAPAESGLVGADASHAWVSLWCGPELGWLEFDPTNALIVTDEHISVAYGRDFSDVTPLGGVIMGGGHHELAVSVKVERLDDTAAEPESPTPA
jgi:transglutaminase-like putative cysteine protease